MNEGWVTGVYETSWGYSSTWVIGVRANCKEIHGCIREGDAHEAYPSVRLVVCLALISIYLECIQSSCKSTRCIMKETALPLIED